MTAKELGESAERFTVNKVNALQSNKWFAYIIPNKDDLEKNHKEGDVGLVYYNEKIICKYIIIRLDIKASDTHEYPIINVNAKEKGVLKKTRINSELVDLDTPVYFAGVTHQFYLGIGNYDFSSENNTNIEFKYSLVQTPDFIQKILNDTAFFEKYKHQSNEDIDGADFIPMRCLKCLQSFIDINRIPTMEDVLNIIEILVLKHLDEINNTAKKKLLKR